MIISTSTNAAAPALRPPANPPATDAAQPPPPQQADPKDTKEPAHHAHLHLSPAAIKQGAEKGFVWSLDIRFPTTTGMISEEKRNKILQSIQPGDIMLETDNSYPGWQRLEYFAMRSNYTHAAMYEGDGKFIEATTPNGCQRTDLKEYLQGPLMICIVRPAYKTPEDREAALNFCRAQLGKPYNTSFKMGDPKSLYCAELVYKALQAMPNKIDVPLIKFHGMDVVAPDGFEALQGATKVYDDKSRFWTNQLSTWPIMASGAAGAALACHFGGWPAAIGGFLAGTATSICVGNKIQTGHFGFTGDAK